MAVSPASATVVGGATHQFAASGKEGHYGLRGMRERAASIGATLTIAAASPGTQVNLVVPGHTVFQGNSAARTAGL